MRSNPCNKSKYTVGEQKNTKATEPLLQLETHVVAIEGLLWPLRRGKTLLGSQCLYWRLHTWTNVACNCGLSTLARKRNVVDCQPMSLKLCHNRANNTRDSGAGVVYQQKFQILMASRKKQMVPTPTPRVQMESQENTQKTSPEHLNDMNKHHQLLAVVVMVPRILLLLPSNARAIVVSSSTQKHWNRSPSFTETDIAKETSMIFHQLQTWHASVT